MGPTPQQIVGVILAGGQSRRMFEAEGRTGDKGLLDLSGTSMLGRVIERLRPQVAALAINANGDPQRFSSFGLPIVADSVQGFVGPLAGVLAGMQWAAAHAPDATHIVTTSSDAPFLPHDLVSLLAASLVPDAPIVLAASGGELHPVIGLWPINLAYDLETQLRNGVRKVLAWTDRHGTRTADFPMLEFGGTRIDPFFNANTPAEFDEARRLLAIAGSAGYN